MGGSTPSATRSSDRVEKMGTTASAQAAKAFESKSAEDVKAALEAMDEDGKKQVAELLGVEPTASAEDFLTALNGLDDEKRKKALELLDASKPSAEAEAKEAPSAD